MKLNIELIKPCYGTTYIRHINGLYLKIDGNSFNLSAERFLWKIDSFENDLFYIGDVNDHDKIEYYDKRFNTSLDSGYSAQHWKIYKQKGCFAIQHADSKLFLCVKDDSTLSLKEDISEDVNHLFIFEDACFTDGFPYVEIVSETQKITLRVEPTILKIVNKQWLKVWTDDLEKSMYSLSRLTGNFPFLNIEVRAHANSNHWGYIFYGKPVVHINKNDFENEIIRMRKHKNRTISFGTLHELCHLYDNAEWLFDAEALANIKIPYVLKELGFTVSIDSKLTNYENYASALYKGHGKLDNIKGLFCSSLAAKITEISYVIGWEPFKKTFKSFPKINNASKAEKFKVFIDKLSEYSNTNVKEMITNKEWESILKNLK